MRKKNIYHEIEYNYTRIQRKKNNNKNFKKDKQSKYF